MRIERMEGMDCYKFGCDENLKRIERMEGMDFISVAVMRTTRL